MPLVFTYGPDTVQGRMFDRIGPTEFLGTALLDGYQLSFDKPNLKDKREGLPNLREAEGAQTFGLLFELTGKQLEQLDGFFGGYEQRPVRVTPEGVEAPKSAKAWLARRTKGGLFPSRTNLELTRRGLEENGAPAAFLEELSRFEVLDA